jgi:hypothetical protein
MNTVIWLMGQTLRDTGSSVFATFFEDDILLIFSDNYDKLKGHGPDIWTGFRYLGLIGLGLEVAYFF